MCRLAAPSKPSGTTNQTDEPEVARSEVGGGELDGALGVAEGVLAVVHDDLGGVEAEVEEQVRGLQGLPVLQGIVRVVVVGDEVTQLGELTGVAVRCGEGDVSKRRGPELIAIPGGAADPLLAIVVVAAVSATIIVAVAAWSVVAPSGALRTRIIAAFKTAQPCCAASRD